MLGDLLRKRLIPVLEGFRRVQMWTFTVDPKLFKSPEEAYRYIRKRRAISRTIAKWKELGYLHSGRWFCIVEWQKNGMPHWHVLLDASRVPFRKACEVWNAFRPAWAGPVEGVRPGLGSIRFSVDRNFDCHEHAAFYACKYLTKQPKGGFPDWVLDFKGRIRRYETSRGFWPKETDIYIPGYGYVPGPEQAIQSEKTVVQSSSERVTADNIIPICDGVTGEHHQSCVCPECLAAEDDRPPKKKTTIRERLAKCKQTAVVLGVERGALPDGRAYEVKHFMRDVEIPFWKIAKLLNQKPPKTGPLILTKEEFGKLEIEFLLEAAA